MPPKSSFSGKIEGMFRNESFKQFNIIYICTVFEASDSIFQCRKKLEMTRTKQQKWTEAQPTFHFFHKLLVI